QTALARLPPRDPRRLSSLLRRPPPPPPFPYTTLFRSRPEHYLTEDGEFNRDRATNGPWAAGIPGLPAAFVHLAAEYGELPLARSDRKSTPELQSRENLVCRLLLEKKNSAQ